ncbi:MAG TPA: hypothetical protein VHC20_04695 [Candidatus Paceibacterota bacterium]|nr:hypothetical protein [Candidatus Paceibacterota bacterium]
MKRVRPCVAKSLTTSISNDCDGTSPCIDIQFVITMPPSYRRSIPPDFPRTRPLASVTGAQPKLAVRLVDGRFTNDFDEQELAQRFQNCDDLLGQLRPYCERKQAEHPEWSLNELLAKVSTSLQTKGWGLTDAEISWIVNQLRLTAFGGPKTSAVPPPSKTQSEGLEADRREAESNSTPAAKERRREARRLALHQAAVRVLRANPERADSALQTLDRWVAAGFPDRDRAEAWRRIIISRNWDVLLEDSEQGRRLRKGSPISCVVDQEERLAIIQSFSVPRLEE